MGIIKRINSLIRKYLRKTGASPEVVKSFISSNLAAFNEQASHAYELFIIDTPPILAATDAAIIGNQAGTTLMLARNEQSPLKEIITAANRLDLNGVDIKGLIFNAFEKKSSYYNYGYEFK